jgi:hypothetical protein
MRLFLPMSLSFLSFRLLRMEVFNAVISIKSNAAGVDDIPLSFMKPLLPVLLGLLIHVFNHIFTCSEFPARWRPLWCCRLQRLLSS